MTYYLNLLAGEWVYVKSQEEILATLDTNGRLDNMPFMPEMFKYCGSKIKVYKRADKTCDTITVGRSRRIYNTVHLENIRCNGEYHGDCDATCLIYWKEDWLKRDYGSIQKSNISNVVKNCSIDIIYNETRKNSSVYKEDVYYSCQATEIINASSPLQWWDIRQYWRDYKSNNADIKTVLSTIAVGIVNWILEKRGIGRILFLINGSRRYPFMDNRLLIEGPTPVEKLDLKTGDYVEVKQVSEILKTLNTGWRNKGLYYDRYGEAYKYCGKKFKVLKKVKKVIDEKTGVLITMNNDSVILEGAVCCGHFSKNRLLCPRSLYIFWREIWLIKLD